MSEFDWTYLEDSKQDIITGKTVYTLWDIEMLKEINPTLTEEEMCLILLRFDKGSGFYLEAAHETLEYLVEETISERRETTT